ncbi:MAG: hypothetical protein ABSH50_19470 [Bryobacteraceae bacterium]
MRSRPPCFFGFSFLPATVVASALGASVQFVETTASPSSSAGQVSIDLLSSASPPALTGSAGTAAATPIVVTASSPYGPLPGVQVALQSGDLGEPVATCATQPGQQAGTVLTNGSGVASCTPVFGSRLGSGIYYVGRRC